MTSGKYKRLTLVLCLPLLMAGVVLSITALKDEHYATVRCEHGTIIGLNCRITDGLGEAWDREIESQYPEWFDIQTVEFEDNSFPYFMASGSQMEIRDVEIVRVWPYLGTDEGPGSPVEHLKLKAARREPITIQFGVGNRANDMRFLDPLGCNELDLTDTPSTPSAGLCGVENGVVGVEFRADPDGQAYFEKLSQAIATEIDRARTDLILGYVFLTLIPLALYFFLSALVWTVRRGYLYVVSG